MADNNFEQNVRSRMEEFAISPSAAVWQQVNDELQKKKRKRRWFFIWLPMIALVVGGSIYTLSQYTGTKDSTAGNKIITKQHPEQSLFTESKPVQQIIDQQLAADPAQTKDEKPQQAALQTQRAITITKETPQLKTQSKEQPVQLRKQVTRKEVDVKPLLVSQKKTNAQQTTVATLQKKNPSNGNLANTSNKKEDKNDVAVDMPYRKEQPGESVKITTDEKINSPADSTAKAATDITVQINNRDTITATFANPEKPAASVPVIKTPNNKWQIGLQVNAGIADVGAVPLPFVSYKSADAAFTTGGSIAGNPQNRVTNSYNYEIKNNLQFGGGLLLRKKIAKKLFFSTGLQYQYTSFTATEKLRIDSFSVPASALFTIADRQTETKFETHYLSVPTELQWQLFKRNTGTLHLSAGFQHFIRISNKNRDSIPGFILQRTFSGATTGQNQPTIALYQPMLHLAPSYEWQKNKNTFSFGWYFNYGLLKVYSADGNYHWRQTGLTFRYFFAGK
jgi:hypothetical protein